MDEGTGCGPNRQKRVLKFLVVAIGWSWSIWGLVLYGLRATAVDPSLLMPLILLGACGPTIAAIFVTATEGGRSALRTLLGRFLIWRVGIRWYVLAIVGPSVFVGIGLALARLAGADLGEVSFAAWPFVFVYLLSAIPTGALAEELGWRGFLLPLLRERQGAAMASLAVGLVWFCWHIPLFWAPTGTTVSGQPVTVTAVTGYAAFVVSVSFLFTWIHDNTRGSVLLAVLLHAGLNAGIPFLFVPDVRLLVDGAISDTARTATHFAAAPVGVIVLGLLAFYGTRRFCRVDQS